MQLQLIPVSMSETDPKNNYPVPPPSSSSSSSSSSNGNGSGSDHHHHHGSTKYSGHDQKIHYNPPDAVNPDAATLREQWKYATRQYSKWYSHAWGTAILAGLAFFALGWAIKGENPLLSFRSQDPSSSSSSSSESDRDRPRP